MKPRENPNRLPLANGSRIGVIGGGPAGAFFAIHLLNRARELGLDLSLHIFERRRSNATASQCPGANWKGCNYCAGGLSPKLIDTLEELGLAVPESIVQGKVRTITIEGHWKNIEFHVPEDRKMLAVYRGSRPAGRPNSRASFDAFLLDEAIRAGAHLAGAEITGADFTPAGRPLLGHKTSAGTQWTELDFVVFASGVNEMASCVHHGIPLLDTIRRLMPAFVPPALRRTLIFELEADPHLLASLDGQIHFPEYGSRMLRLEMCSIIPKRGFITVVLVGGSVDQAKTEADYQRILSQFLEQPHIHRLLARCDHTRMACCCNPSMVVGTARHPFADRVAVVGDLATTRLYKDGILSACQTARALAETALEAGIDIQSLAQGYLPAIERFRRDNRFAAVVFRLHRIFFSSPMLSRVLYQAVITERKNSWRGERRLKRLLWQIASGDAQYEDIFYSAIHPPPSGWCSPMACCSPSGITSPNASSASTGGASAASPPGWPGNAWRASGPSSRGSSRNRILQSRTGWNSSGCTPSASWRPAARSWTSSALSANPAGNSSKPASCGSPAPLGVRMNPAA